MSWTIFVLLLVHLVNSSLYALTSAQLPSERVECLDSCNIGSIVLGRDPNIGACCGLRGSGRNGGAFILESNSCRSCDDFRRITGQIEITVNPQPPALGQDLTITCLVTTDPLFRATGAVAFSLPNGNIVDDVNHTSPRTTIVYEVSPLEDLESILGTFTCNVTLFSPEYPGLGARQFETITFDGGNDNAQNLTIEEISIPTAGQPYTLVCRTNVTTNLLTWFAPSGEELMTDDRVQVGDLIQNEGTTSRRLTINELTETDLGVYTCTSGGTNTTIRVLLQETPPLAVVRIISPSMPPQLGKPYSSTCLVIPTELLPATIEVLWIGPDGMLLASQTITEDMFATEEISLQLNLNDLDSSDAGLYMCAVVITSPILNTPQVIRRMLNLSLPDVSDEECIPEGGDCDPNASCIMDSGIPRCVCNTGFIGDGNTCQDVDECACGTHNCSWNSQCVNTIGSFECVCKAGFSGDGFNCKDIDECRTLSNICHSRAHCYNTYGGYMCKCFHGFIGDGQYCCRRLHKRPYYRKLSQKKKRKKSTGKKKSKNKRKGKHGHQSRKKTQHSHKGRKHTRDHKNRAYSAIKKYGSVWSQQKLT